MTYCLGIAVRDGLVMVADTRMSAGPDNISTYRKLHVIADSGERAITVATAGNLPATQAVLGLLEEGIENPHTGRKDTLFTVPTMFRAAQLIGHAIRHVRASDAESLDWARLSFDVSILLGGQIRGEAMRLFMVYPAGNFVESGQESPFLQIGDHKYGKSVLARAITTGVDLYDALKIGLISMDDALRANVEVGLPVDIVVLRRDTLDAELIYRIHTGDPFFHDLRERWGAALRAAHMNIPRPPYGSGEKQTPTGRYGSLTNF